MAGLFLVALALLVLQAVYVGMVALCGYATWRYLLALPGILSTVRVNQLTVILLLAPLVAGVLMTLFLLKPLLSRPPKSPKAYRLQAGDQPVLRAFVDLLCDRLAAPRPTSIEMDLAVNASARLNGWRGLVRGDVVLTVGIPLATGLTLRQFSGVLAHEFGHFSQRVGMRLRFLIESIRIWFERVAYERDSWDEWLDRTFEGNGWRTKAVLGPARGGVFVSRKILQGLLVVGRFASAWFSRQMEFDADRHEAELAGCEVFASTFGRMAVLSVASERAWNRLNQTHRRGQLCDDFAGLLRHWDGALSSEDRDSIVESSFATEVGRWATHPSNRDRVERAKAAQGVLPEGDDPAAEVLFQELAQLCREVTRHHYETVLGDGLAAASVLRASEYSTATARSETRAAALATFFGALCQPARYFRLPGNGMHDGIELQVCLSDASEKYWSLLETSLNRRAALEFVRNGGRVKPTAFHLSSGDPDVVAEEAAKVRRELADETARLGELCAGQAAAMGQVDSPFVAAYRLLSEQQEPLVELRHRLVALDLLQSNLGLLDMGVAATAVERAMDGLRQMNAKIVAALAAQSSPLSPGLRLDEELLDGDEVDELEPYVVAGRLLNNYDTVAGEVLGEVCAALQDKAESGG